MSKDRPGPTAVPAARPRRVVITHIEPEVERGRFPAKRIIGDEVVVAADIFADGHDALQAVLRHRHAKDSEWSETPMREVPNDRWKGGFRVGQTGRYEFMLQAWVDRFATWRRDFKKKVEAGRAAEADLRIGSELVSEACEQGSGSGGAEIAAFGERLRRTGLILSPDAVRVALDERLAELMAASCERRESTTYERTLTITVDPERSRSSAWYEMFPRSASPERGRHGTFKDCEERLAYIASMGFDVLYLPPIHPIGMTHRKGKNGTSAAAPGDPGSVWAIGSAEGGHTSTHPELGTLDDFRRLVRKAREFEIDIALDLAYQCSPDHPYVKNHAEWFRHRPDGLIQCAENPPNSYDDIYPFDFETDAWEEFWQELKHVVVFWIEQGVRTFRVDNPHTKPFAFWEWLIGEIKGDYPDVILLAESFTRPNPMYRLTQLGFTHSYTYFTWRTSKRELTEYFTELMGAPLREHFRPHLWPTTPDVLPEHLQTGGRPAFITRLVLAATLAGNYGIYGPPYELCDGRPLSPGHEQFADSEMFEVRHWDIAQSQSLREIIARVNQIRRENPALRRDAGLSFHPVSNDQLIAYTKSTDDRSNVILVVVNLDPHNAQSGVVDLPIEELGVDSTLAFEVDDLLGRARYTWRGARNFVELHPGSTPAHVFRIRQG